MLMLPAVLEAKTRHGNEQTNHAQSKYPVNEYFLKSNTLFIGLDSGSPCNKQDTFLKFTFQHAD